MATVRDARVDALDARALLEEYFAFRTAGFTAIGVRYSAVLPEARVFTPPAGLFLLAVDADVAVGCGGIRRLPDAPAGARWELKHLYLRESARGHGWGRMLLDALELRARAFGAAELVLDTHHSLDAAAALYRSAGFTAIEPYNDNPNATVWLAKPLA